MEGSHTGTERMPFNKRDLDCNEALRISSQWCMKYNLKVGYSITYVSISVQEKNRLQFLAVQVVR